MGYEGSRYVLKSAGSLCSVLSKKRTQGLRNHWADTTTWLISLQKKKTKNKTTSGKRREKMIVFCLFLFFKHSSSLCPNDLACRWALYWCIIECCSTSPFENSIWLNCSPFFPCFYLEKEKKVWDSIRRVGLHLFIDADVLCFQLVCKVTDDHLLFFLGCGAVKIHQKHIEMPHPIFRALTHIISVLSSFQGDKKPGLQLCRESRRDGEKWDDQDSSGGSASSSTGFGCFVRIASASSNIWGEPKEEQWLNM